MRGFGGVAAPRQEPTRLIGGEGYLLKINLKKPRKCILVLIPNPKQVCEEGINLPKFA